MVLPRSKQKFPKSAASPQRSLELGSATSLLLWSKVSSQLSTARRAHNSFYATTPQEEAWPSVPFTSTEKQKSSSHAIRKKRLLKVSLPES